MGAPPCGRRSSYALGLSASVPPGPPLRGALQPTWRAEGRGKKGETVGVDPPNCRIEAPRGEGSTKNWPGQTATGEGYEWVLAEGRRGGCAGRESTRPTRENGRSGWPMAKAGDQRGAPGRGRSEIRNIWRVQIWKLRWTVTRGSRQWASGYWRVDPRRTADDRVDEGSENPFEIRDGDHTERHSEEYEVL
jgi:hypothetical protein